MYRLSLDEAVRQKPKTVAQLERVREMYMRKIERADQDELLNLFIFFKTKEAEMIVHEALLREAQPDFPRLITDELMSSKSRMIILWRGLKEEAARRM